MAQQEKEKPPSFAAMLAAVRPGTDIEAAETLRKVVAAVKDTGKVGSLVIRLDVKPADGGLDAVIVTDKLTQKIPEKTRAVEVSITFLFVRPPSVSEKKRPLPSVMPDIDKLARAVLDGLTAGGVVTDDARVVDLHARKRYGTVARAEITVREVQP